MPISVRFDDVEVGASYDRKTLARLWGYAGFQAIARGVVTPAGSPHVILFVTEDKQESLTQYRDFLVDGKLHWEGETKHGSDDRIVRAGFGPDQIHLFHRERHHTDFTYLGRIYLEQHQIRIDAPSQFIFYIESGHSMVEDAAGHETDFPGDGAAGRRTERAAIVASRVGQGVFRDGLLRLWRGCAVTGYGRSNVLVASHIKPWKDSDNLERLSSFNGLILQPNIDKLFDRGLVTFADDGCLIRSRDLRDGELGELGLGPKPGLLQVYDGMRRFLEYHRDVEFEK